MAYIGTSINNSPTVVGMAAAELVNGAFLAVKYDGSGKLILAGEGDHALGLLIPETEEKAVAGSTLTVQIKDIGLWTAGAAVKAGAELACGADGKCVTAATGKFILAVALNSVEAGGVARVQIIKAGCEFS